MDLFTRQSGLKITIDQLDVSLGCYLHHEVTFSAVLTYLSAEGVGNIQGNVEGYHCVLDVYTVHSMGTVGGGPAHISFPKL